MRTIALGVVFVAALFALTGGPQVDSPASPTV